MALQQWSRIEPPPVAATSQHRMQIPQWQFVAFRKGWHRVMGIPNLAYPAQSTSDMPNDGELLEPMKWAPSPPSATRSGSSDRSSPTQPADSTLILLDTQTFRVAVTDTLRTGSAPTARGPPRLRCQPTGPPYAQPHDQDCPCLFTLSVSRPSPLHFPTTT